MISAATGQKVWNTISWVALATLIVYLAASCIVKTVAPSINLDDGWIAALNYFPSSKYYPGKDYNYTYGPLGFILQCQDIWPNKLITSLFLIFTHAAIAWVLWLYRRAFSPGKFLLFAIAALLSQFATHGDTRTPAGDEYAPLVMLVMLLSVSLISSERIVVLSSILAGIFSGLLLFIKFDLAIEAVMTLGVYLALSYIFAYEYKPKALAALSIGLAFGFFLPLITLFKGLDNFGLWVLSCLKIAHAYAESWNENCPVPWCLYLSLLFVLIYLIVVVPSAIKKEKLGYLGLVLLPSILLGCRHGFVLGNSWHIVSFYKYALVVTALLLIYCCRRVDIALLIIPFIVFLPLIAYLDHMYARDCCEVGNPKRLESMRLSQQFLPNQERTSKSFDGIPTNMMWCFANDLQYKPNPSLILNLSCSKTLDKEAANYLAGSGAPDYLFCEFLTLCGRHMFFENPHAWRTIIDLYKMYKFDEERQTLLLAKDKVAQLAAIKNKEQFTCTGGQWYFVPPNKHLLFCSFDFRLNNLGQISQLFYKIPAVFLNVQYADKQIQSYRLMPANSSAGLLINYLPQDLQALEELCLGTATNHVVRFELLGPGLAYYQPLVPAMWLESNRQVNEKPPEKLSFAPIETREKFFIDSVIMKTSGADLVGFIGPKDILPTFNYKDGVVDLTLWIFETDKKTPVQAVCIQIDQNQPIKTASRILAAGRGGSYACRESMTAGYKTGIDMQNLSSGLHTINLYIQSKKDGQFYKIPDTIKFQIETVL